MYKIKSILDKYICLIPVSFDRFVQRDGVASSNFFTVDCKVN